MQIFLMFSFMKKLLLLASLLLLAACQSATPAPRPESTQTPEMTENTEATTTLSYTEAIQSASKTITANSEFNACLVPYVDACVQQTGYSIALAEKNTDICRELSTGDQQDACRLGVILSTAHEHQNIHACDSLEVENNKRSCQEAIHRTMAMSQQDTTLCRPIAQLYSGEEAEIGAINQEQCALEVILASENPELAQCDVLTTEHLKTHCQESIRMQAEMRRLETPALETPTSESSAQ